MMKKGRKVWHVLAFIAVVAAAIAIVMVLWNLLIPSVIGWSAINYWQAAGLLVLCKLLFGGFGHRMHGWRHHHHHADHHRHGFGLGHSSEEREAFREAMKGMSPDERRNFIREAMFNKFRGSCDRKGSEDEK